MFLINVVLEFLVMMKMFHISAVQCSTIQWPRMALSTLSMASETKELYFSDLFSIESFQFDFKYPHVTNKITQV